MDDCPPLDELLRSAVGSTRLESEMAPLDAHLKDCSKCQKALEERMSQTRADDEAGPLIPLVPGYQIDPKPLGSGSMGVVYRARQTATGRTVALKFLGGFAGFDGPWRRRLLNEARAQAEVDHPNFVRLYDARAIPGGLVIVMEYYAGGSLADRLDGPLPPDLAARLLIPVARALQVAHDKHWIHLDVKPSNIMLDGEPGEPLDRAVPKLADFGLAFRIGPDASWSLWTGPRGTAGYMAPEVQLGRPDAPSPRCDIYSLGAVLYCLLTGGAPSSISAEDRDEVATRGLPPEAAGLEPILRRCLQADPEARYPAACAVAEDLERFLRHVPIPAGISTPHRIPRLPKNASRARYAAVACLLIALAAGGAMIMSMPGPRPSQRASAETIAIAGPSDELDALDPTTFQQLAESIGGRSHTLSMEASQQLVKRRLQLLQDKDARESLSYDESLELSDLANRLACQLAEKGRYDEAAPFFEVSIRAANQCRRLLPDDSLAAFTLSQAYLAGGLHAVGHGEERLGLERLKASGESLLHVDLNDDTAIILSHVSLGLSDLAHRKLLRGDQSGAAFVALAHREVYKTVEPHVRRSVTLSVLKASMLASQGDESAADAAFESAVAMSHDPQAWLDPCAEHLPRALAAWALQRTWLKEMPPLPESETGTRVPGKIAQALVSRLEVDAPRVHDGPNEDHMAILLQMIHYLHKRTVTQRQAGQIDAALLDSTIVQRFAERMTETHPDRYEPQALLCEATLQMAKIGWAEDDLPTVRLWLTRSLEAAMAALRIDPTQRWSDFAIVDRRERLGRLSEAEAEAAAARLSLQTPEG